MKKVYYSWEQVQGAVLELVRQLQKDKWVPDYIVGITRGGAIPAILLSQYTGIPMRPLEVSLRDGGQCVSDLGMAEDAFGYVTKEDRQHEHIPFNVDSAKNILVVDDINDSGATIEWIKNDWRSGCMPGDERWDWVWGSNVRFAVLTDNLASKESVDYSVWEVNKAEEDCWLVYPWEHFWLK
jgi:hypoxanthine phosphoribosyltransferase